MFKGKIYFKSNTFGVQTLIEFPLSSIVSIKPKIMTPLVYPVAIKIVVQSGEAVSRNHTLLLRQGPQTN
jgi:ABC-type multidrug transport system permease subunit